MDKFHNGRNEMEPWIETHSGKTFRYDSETSTEGIDIQDIAAALSKMCRYTGHCNRFYSVAEHSFNVSALLPPEKRLFGLLHDSSEAFLADIAAPVKQLLPEYKKLERTIMGRIAKAFSLPDLFWLDEEIKRADWAMLKSEAKVLIPSKGKDWYFPEGLPKGITPLCVDPAMAEYMFLQAYERLTNGSNSGTRVSAPAH